MKRILLFAIMLMMVTVSAFADKQEWIDKNYDFGKAKRILVSFSVPDELKNGITEKETEEIFFEVLQDKVTDKLAPLGYKVKTLTDVNDDIQLLYGVNFTEQIKNNTVEAEKIFEKYINENVDLLVNVQLLTYSTGNKYKEGYYRTVPKTESHYVSNGMFGGQIVTTHTTEQQYVAPQNVPMTYTAVKFIIDDVKTKENVWTRIDNREREGDELFGNSKPKEVFERIIKSGFGDFTDKLKDTAGIEE